MRPLILPLLAALLPLVSSPPAAAFGEVPKETAAVGGTLTMGSATTLGEGYAGLARIDLQPGLDKSLSFSAGGGAYIDYYFVPWFGVEGGIGFVGKGVRYKGAVLGEPWRTRLRLIYMELPISLKFNIARRFRIGLGVALWVAVSGKEKTHAGDAVIENKLDEDRLWAPYHRANVGPKVSLAYAIPLGPVHILPGASWMMHIVNDLDNDDIPGDTDYVMREMNVMLNVGVEWFFR